MNLPRAMAASGLSWALLCATAPAQAAGSLHRCQTEDGLAVYTDRACASLGARPAPMSADLLARLTMEPAGFEPDSLRARTMGTAIRTRRPPQNGCARSPRQLSIDLLGSFAMGDVNRIAESVHWPGLRHRQAHEVMRRLQLMARQPLVDASFWPGLAGSGAGAGAMQLTFAHPAQVMELGVEHHAGCYFVRF